MFKNGFELEKSVYFVGDHPSSDIGLTESQRTTSNKRNHTTLGHLTAETATIFIA